LTEVSIPASFTAFPAILAPLSGSKVSTQIAQSESQSFHRDSKNVGFFQFFIFHKK
jgi:hypothetical protein